MDAIDMLQGRRSDSWDGERAIVVYRHNRGLATASCRKPHTRQLKTLLGRSVQLFVALLHLVHRLLNLLLYFFLGLAGLLQLHLFGGTGSGGSAGAFEPAAPKTQRYCDH